MSQRGFHINIMYLTKFIQKYLKLSPSQTNYLKWLWVSEAGGTWRKPHFFEPCEMALQIHNKKKLYQKTETTLIEDFHRQLQLKWISRVNWRENNKKIKMLIFDTTLNKKLGNNSPSIPDNSYWTWETYFPKINHHQ